MNTLNYSSALERSLWIDRIKIFAAFLVVLQHSISPVWSTFPIDTLTWKITNLIFILSRSAVTLFFMCSGAGMLRHPRSIEDVLKKNILPLLKVYCCWMLIYGFFDSISLIQSGSASIRTVSNAFLKCILFGKYHTWFIFALIGLYLITPFLSSITSDYKHMSFFLLLSFFFTILMPLLSSISLLDRLTLQLNNFHLNYITGYILYYVIGYFISSLEWKKSYSRLALLLFGFSYIFAFIYSTGISLRRGAPSQEIYDEFGICGFFIAISVFALFKGKSIWKERKICTILLQSGIGIYLLHPLLLPLFESYTGLQRMAVSLVLYGLVVFICQLINRSRLFQNLLLKS
ncbi:MAG: acyltransferase [Lachnospiraceae bacterium]